MRVAVASDDARPLPTIVAELNRAGATGILAVTAREGRRELILVDGEVRAARSNIESEKLGSWLVGRRVISIQDKALGLMTQGSVSSPFGHVLVMRGLIEQATLEQELQDLALTIVERATVQRRTRLDFAERPSQGQLDTLPNMTTPMLILKAARAFTDIKVKREVVGGLGQRAWMARPVEMLRQELELTDSEARILEGLRQPKSLNELLSVTGLQDSDLVAAIYALMTARAVRIGEMAASAIRGDTGVFFGPEDDRAAQPVVAAAETVPQFTLEERKEREFILRAVSRTAERNHYQNLGLEYDAGAHAVEEAWKKLAPLFRPERAAEPHLADLGEQLQIVHERLREAHETLSEAKPRRLYDQFLRTDSGQYRAVSAGGEAVGPAPTPEPAAPPPEPAAPADERPQRAHRAMQRAEEAMASGDLFAAHESLEIACQLEPKPDRLVKLAKLMMFNPTWDSEALGRIKAALELDPRYVDGWLVLAGYWRRRQNKERERKALERAIAADPRHTEAIARYRELVGDDQVERFLARARGQ